MSEIQIRAELLQLKNDALIFYIKHFDNEDVSKLQLAWEILEERGLKNQVLSELEKEDKENTVPLKVLLNIDIDVPVDENLAHKIKQNIGKDIVVKRTDILGQQRNYTIHENDLSDNKLSPEEKEKIRRKSLIHVFYALASLVAVLVFMALNLAFTGKNLIEYTLLIHTALRLGLAYSNYKISKNEN